MYDYRVLLICTDTILKNWIFTGLQAFESVLYPRVRALQVCVEQLKDTVDCIYDVTIGYGRAFNFKKKQRMVAPSMQGLVMFWSFVKEKKNNFHAPTVKQCMAHGLSLFLPQTSYHIFTLHFFYVLLFILVLLKVCIFLLIEVMYSQISFTFMSKWELRNERDEFFSYVSAQNHTVGVWENQIYF